MAGKLLPLFPGRVHVLADQIRWIRALPRTELLRGAATDRREIQVLLLIHADAVRRTRRP